MTTDATDSIAQDSSSTAPSDSTASSEFLGTPDLGDLVTDCDLYTQDCPLGEKCMPWANDGGSAWNSTRCSPIADEPGGEGDPCTVVDSGTSGIDDCGLGLMCWNVDESNEGHCENLCTGSAHDAICDDPNEVCLLSGAPFAHCVDRCDPLAQDCPDEHQVCYPDGVDWICAFDGSGELGIHGDPCEYMAACDAGHACLGAAAFTDCSGAVGCCSALCSFGDADDDAMCAGLDPAQACVAWYEPGLAPPGLESVGACALP